MNIPALKTPLYAGMLSGFLRPIRQLLHQRGYIGGIHFQARKPFDQLRRALAIRMIAESAEPFPVTFQ